MSLQADAPCEAFGLLGKHNLLFEHYHHDWATQLPRLARLAAAHPDVTIVINHLGGRCNTRTPWLPQLVRSMDRRAFRQTHQEYQTATSPTRIRV